MGRHALDWSGPGWGQRGGPLWTRIWSFGLHKMRGISWLAGELLASQEICSIWVRFLFWSTKLILKVYKKYFFTLQENHCLFFTKKRCLIIFREIISVFLRILSNIWKILRDFNVTTLDAYSYNCVWGKNTFDIWYPPPPENNTWKYTLQYSASLA
jgi:hypothetical protein